MVRVAKRDEPSNWGFELRESTVPFCYAKQSVPAGEIEPARRGLFVEAAV
jgi:hypothetical protein